MSESHPNLIPPRATEPTMGRKRPDVAAASAAVDLSALPDTASTPSTDEAMVDEPMKNQQVKQSTAVDDKPTRRRKPPTSTAAAPSAAAAKPTSAQRVSSIRLIIRLIIMATAAAAIYRAVSNQTPAAVPQVALQDDTPSVDAAGNETKSQLLEAQLSTAAPPEKSPAANEEVVARDDDPIRDIHPNLWTESNRVSIHGSTKPSRSSRWPH